MLAHCGGVAAHDQFEVASAPAPEPHTRAALENLELVGVDGIEGIDPNPRTGEEAFGRGPGVVVEQHDPIGGQVMERCDGIFEDGGRVVVGVDHDEVVGAVLRQRSKERRRGTFLLPEATVSGERGGAEVVAGFNGGEVETPFVGVG